MHEPTFTVVTVCLNVKDSIRLTLESVKMQKKVRIQHIIIDGGSTDGTIEIIQEYNVDTFISEPDDGIYAAMEKARAFVKNDWTIFLNAGDVFYDASTCLKIQKYLIRNKAEVVFGNLLPVYLSGTIGHDHPAFQANKVLDLGYMRNRLDLKRESLHHQATLYSKKIIHKYSFIEQENKAASGEYKLLLEGLSKQNIQIRHIPVTVARFALGGTSTSNFKDEWARYNSARNFLLEKYQFRNTNFSLDEFHKLKHPMGGQKGRIKRSLKQNLKNSLLGQLYRRIENRLIYRVHTDISSLTGDLGVHLDQVHFQIIAEVNARITDLRKEFTLEIAKVVNETKEAVSQEVKSVQEIYSQEISQVLERIPTFINDASKAFESLEVNLLQNLPSLIIDKHQLERVYFQNEIDRISLIISSLHKKTSSFEELKNEKRQFSSQWNEDGIIMVLIESLSIKPKIFIELGCGNYGESNTRHLAQTQLWKGLIVDGDEANIDSVKKWELLWKYNITPVCAFIETKNVNELLIENGFEGEVGILSIDLDGIDYWIWESVTAINPQIVICEFNGFFGSNLKVTVPNIEGFGRFDQHYSGIYAGASIQALISLGKRRNYTLVAINSGSNNAFFVRNDILRTTPSFVNFDMQNFQSPGFREARYPDGSLSFKHPREFFPLMLDLPLVDVELNSKILIGDILDDLT